MQKWKDITTHGLRAQVGFLEAVRTHHLFWAERMDNPKIAHIHVEIVDLLVQTMSQYNHLLDEYDNLTN
jgi:hypothetical protein